MIGPSALIAEVALITEHYHPGCILCSHGCRYCYGRAVQGALDSTQYSVNDIVWGLRAYIAVGTPDGSLYDEVDGALAALHYLAGVQALYVVEAP